MTFPHVLLVIGNVERIWIYRKYLNLTEKGLKLICIDVMFVTGEQIFGMALLEI